MDRAERSTSVQGSDFGRFQTGIMLEELVQRRTEELEEAFRENEKIHRALRESEARFRGVVSQSLVGIAIIEDGRCTYANPKLAQMLGYSVEEIQRLPLRDVVPKSDSQLIEDQIRRCLGGQEEPGEFVFKGLRKDGALIDIESHSSVMEMGGKSVLISMMIGTRSEGTAGSAPRAGHSRPLDRPLQSPAIERVFRSGTVHGPASSPTRQYGAGGSGSFQNCQRHLWAPGWR
jgi:PAS domain S-box-containing protein